MRTGLAERAPADARAAVAQCLEQARRQWRLNCFIKLFDTQAKAAARACAERARAGRRLPLDGVTFAVKDIFRLGARRPTAGAMFDDLGDGLPSSPVIERLLGAGACLVGATNLDEICYGTTGLNPHFGAVRNPLDPERVAGGSSSGAAAAVQAGLADVAVGTDTGGSVRIPAAFCGLVGFKPTLGLLPTAGTVPLSATQDCIGLLTRSVPECAALMDVLVPAAWQLPADEGEGRALLRTVRFGFLRHAFTEPRDACVDQALARCEALLAANAAQVREVAGDFLQECDRHATAITGYEVSRLHAHRIERGFERFSAPTRSRLQRAALVGEHEYEAARRYHRDCMARPPLRASGVDVFVLPTTVRLAPRIAELDEHVDATLAFTMQALRATRPFSFLGGPAISLPAGPAHGGLRAAVQLVAAPGDDARLLRVARALEQLLAQDGPLTRLPARTAAR